MPKEENNFLKYNQINKSLKNRFFIYTDTESQLE